MNGCNRCKNLLPTAKASQAMDFASKKFRETRGLLLGAAALALCLGGCRTPRLVTELREENRQLEERLYQLAELLADCRRENRRLREQLETAREATPPVLPEAPPQKEPTSHESPLPKEPPLPRIEVEGVPQPDKKTGELRPTEPPANFLSTAPRPPAAPEAAPEHRSGAVRLAAASGSFTSLTQLPATENSRVIERIELNPHFTGGWNPDGQPGDEGIQVLVEPRDELGRIVRAAGELSLVLVDPALAGREARVARWDIPASQAAESFFRCPAGEGIVLFLPWQERIPVHSRLHLFVRLTREDGRKLERDMPIEVALSPTVGSFQPSANGAPSQDKWTEAGQGATPPRERETARSARIPPEWSPLR